MNRSATRRIGLIVPSSNTTMETEIPELLRRHAQRFGTSVTLHSSRARLASVDASSLDRMVGEASRCAVEVGDAEIDAVAYACLVAVMVRNPGAHSEVEKDISRALANGPSAKAPVVSSAGALVRTMRALGLRQVALVAPYMPALTTKVVDYLRGERIVVTDSVSLSVADNCAVGRLDPENLSNHVEQLDLSGVDGLVLSACVQMPSLPSVQPIQDSIGLPVITAATATTRELLLALGWKPEVPGAGAALASDPVRSATPESTGGGRR